MVKSHSERRDHFNASVDPLEIYLKIKKQKHRYDKACHVQTIKDEFIVPLIDEYELNARHAILAQQAWRKLYYIFYETRQQVKKNE